MTTADLPAWNAALNATSGLLLAAGYHFVRRGEIARHRACMLGAFGVSTGFLASYLVYHALHGSTPFPGSGWWRALYFTILLPHVVLAAALVPFALVTLRRGLGGRYEAHRRIARITLPIWLFVSVTGVLVYWMLYQMRWT